MKKRSWVMWALILDSLDFHVAFVDKRRKNVIYEKGLRNKYLNYKVKRVVVTEK